MTDTVSSLLEKYTGHGSVETCGIITAGGAVVELDNIHETPEQGFHIDPKPFLAAVKAGAVATWHTHPGHDPNLSEEDMAGFLQWPNLTHYIVGIREGVPTVQAFVIEEGFVQCV